MIYHYKMIDTKQGSCFEILDYELFSIDKKEYPRLVKDLEKLGYKITHNKSLTFVFNAPDASGQ